MTEPYQFGDLMLLSGTANPELSEKIAREIDLPLAFVLHGMEQAGVQLDSRVLEEMSAKLAGDGTA